MSKSLLKSTAIVSVMTFLSRIFGFVRDIIIALMFGASGATDAFFVAFKIPNFLRRLFAEGAFSQAFIPVLSEYKTNDSAQNLKQLINDVTGVLAVVLFMVTLLGVLIAPVLVLLFAPGYVSLNSSYETQSIVKIILPFVAFLCASALLSVFLMVYGKKKFGRFFIFFTIFSFFITPFIIHLIDPNLVELSHKYNLTVEMLRLTFPYLFFISLTALSGGILNTFGKFSIPALTPVLLNISLITAAIIFSPYFNEPMIALAWGVFVAGLIQLLFQLPFLHQLKLLPKPSFNRHHPGVKKIGFLMLPALFGVSITQINLLFDTLLASFLETGSVSWLYFSDRLVEFPMGLFGIAIATVILPSLSKKYQSSSSVQFSKTMDWALKWVFLIGVPCSMGLLVLAEPMISTLFQYNAFVANDVMMSAKSLRAYSLGLLGFILIKVLATGYFSRQDTKTPVKIGVIAMLSNMVMNLIFIFPFAHAGLALATSLSAFVNAFLLYMGLKKENIFHVDGSWLKFLFRIFFAGFMMLFCLVYLKGDVLVWESMSAWQRGGKLCGLIMMGILVYFCVLAVLGLRPKSLLDANIVDK
jgi:putative peptidoglycan lipid II flippase